MCNILKDYSSQKKSVRATSGTEAHRLLAPRERKRARVRMTVA